MKPMLVISFAVVVAVSLASSAAAQPRASGKGAPSRTQLRLVPADTALILSIDVAASKRGPLFPRALRLLELSEELARGLELLRSGADIDVRQDVTGVKIAIASDFPTSQRLVYLLDGVFDPGKLAAFAKREPKVVSARVHRGIAYYRLGGKAEVALLGARLVVARKDQARVIIDLHLAGRTPAKHDKRLLGAIASVDRSALLWAAFALPAPLQARVAKGLGGHVIDSVGVSLVASPGLVLALELGMQDAAAAAAITTMIRTALPDLAKKDEAIKLGLVNTLRTAKVSAARTAVSFSLTLDAPALIGLARLLSH